MPRQRPDKPKLEIRRGVYGIVYWEGDTRRRISLGTTDETIARQGLVDFEGKQKTRPAALTFSAALDAYLVYRSDKVMAYDRLAQAARALKDGLGHLRVDQVNQEQWDIYARARMTRPRPRQTAYKPVPVSTGTLRREFNVLRAALRRAWKNKLLDLPPELEAPADSQPRDRYITKDEARALLAHAKGHIKTFVALALFTGARRASILGLTWDRVDFNRGIVNFQEPERQLTKKRRAVVPMTDQLRAVLEQASADRVKDCAYVVAWNGLPVPYGIRWSFAKLCKAAGLTWRPTPHHFKHSVASFFAMDHVPIQQAADWLATDEATLRNTYRKFDPTYLRSAASSLDL